MSRKLEFAIARGDLEIHIPETQHGDSKPSSSARFAKIIKAYMAQAVAAATSAAGSGSWVAKAEVPAPEEILPLDEGPDSENVVDLYPNQINGPWPSPEIYLKTHYELLREDSVAPLRDAVAYARQNPRMKDTQDLCIYEKVYVKGLTCAAEGVAARVQFSTRRAGKNIVWEYSRRLISGNVVALTPADDCFKSKCIVAVVAARPLDGLKSQPPEIDIFFVRPEDADFDTQREWLMVEAKTGYYEAHRHTMKALQKMSTETFPLSKHICGLKSKIDAPTYVEASPEIDMTAIYPEGQSVGRTNILHSWPSPPENLDPSQWDALRHILTKKLSVIQGPPGTGKTHVSVIGLKALLSNMQPHDPPIIVAAQTNHALDQLLRHVSKFEREYVRIGGRSADPDIKKRTLYELGKGSIIRPGNSLIAARKQMRTLTEKLRGTISAFKIDNTDTPLPASFFLKLGLITQTQHDSLVRGSEGWIHNGDRADPVSAWLGENALKFEVVYKEENFGFAEEEIDLEYEQLKELDAEQGLDNDDDESLNGTYISLKEGFTGRRHHTLSKKSAEMKYLKCQDMWKIPPFARGAVYNLLQQRAKEITRESVRSILKDYETAVTDYKAGRWERQCVILQNAKIVGMTTTGLSKYRALISAIRPKIILIEEAAEVLEAPVAAACVESLEHLILVGDHRRLQGHCAVQELEGEPFYLNVSMFERLVHNGVPYKRLCKQRRMIPEIRQILNTIYDNLEDHPSVLGRPGVPGMGRVNSYFFCHTWPESSDSLMSKYNENEAKMVVGFFLYLCMNGVDAKDITVLTFYNGQRKKVLKTLREQPFLQGQYVKVVTVDSYQGEENEIVLLSLVRSNEHNNVGFLSVENRVCVALSRAKRGFYIFGNAEQVALMSPLWWEVVQIMRSSPKRIGYFLPLTCCSHNNKTLAVDADIFNKLDGGCMAKCEVKMPCGHQCPLRCHPIDHSRVRCIQPCTRTLRCGHKCRERCFQDCNCPCKEKNLASPPTEFAKPSSSTVSHEKITLKEEYSEVIEQSRSSVFLHGKIGSEDEHNAFVQRYNDFANGGVAREDKRLADVFHKQAMERRAELQQADDESLEALLGRHTISENTASGTFAPGIAPSATAHAHVHASETDDSTRIDMDGASGTPVRRKYTQYYTTGGHVRTISERTIASGANAGRKPASASQKQEASLLVLD